jgi:hypothetical protein
VNRWDEIQAVARDIASNVHAEPAARDAMADDLIRLCGLMIGAVGKVVACEGEAAIGNGDDNSAYARYLVGERVQDGAREAVEQASGPGCDLDRWIRPSPGDPCACGHVPSVHEGGQCTGERYNREPCKGGPCNGFVRRVPSGGWTHVDRRPAALRSAPYLDPANLDDFGASACKQHTWVTAEDGMGDAARDVAGGTWQHCGVCGARKP